MNKHNESKHNIIEKYLYFECPKGHKCVGSLCRLVKTLIVSSVRPRDQGTRSPIELFWTANYRSYGDTVLYTDWKKDNYFRAIKV